MSLKRCRDDVMEISNIKKYKSHQEQIDSNNQKNNSIQTKQMLYVIIEMMDKANNKINQMENKITQNENDIKLLKNSNVNYKKKIDMLYRCMGVNPDTNYSYTPSYIS